ncbi:alpha/beta hydrolase [Marisediminicola sp. UYEF4]|uniref:alpha/beta hydrolase n=1 Tax=Marisediminicola sp. UYEF4 TaxID=1756384 RepID=UPI0033913661
MKVAAGTGARVLAACVSLVIVLSACAPTGDESEQVEREPVPFPVVQTYPDIDVIENLAYGAGADAGGAEILVDVCLPEVVTKPASVTVEPAPATDDAITASTARAAVLSVHGGSWRQGDKADLYWRSACQWLASEGFVAFSVNYRLAPANPYPAAIDDVRQVVRWLRDDAQVERFDIDPDRIGAFGGSAGGNLVSLLGLEGMGDLAEGSRVAAVVNLSGPIDLTTDGFALGGVVPAFRQVQLDYLGCESYTDCPQALAASPLYSVDESDPPFFVGHSLEEMIPVQQSDALVELLRGAGVDTTYLTVEGNLHSIAMLDDPIRLQIADWLRDKLEP